MVSYYSCFKLSATTSNNMQQGVQMDAKHVTSNKAGSCQPTMFRPFAQGFTDAKLIILSFFRHYSSYTCKKILSD